MITEIKISNYRLDSRVDIAEDNIKVKDEAGRFPLNLIRLKVF
jgi:hypothetical protein